MATQLVPLQEVERLSSRVIRILGGNPGKEIHITRYRRPLAAVDRLLTVLIEASGTNTYLVGTGPQRILLDTGEGEKSWADALRKVLASEQASIKTCLLTHWHLDHISGVADVLDMNASTSIYKHMPSLAGDDEWSDIKNGQQFKTDGATLRAVHCPGHTKDHMAFVLEDENAMFTGDNVLGHGTAVFEDLGEYMSSLRLMGNEFDGRGYPGHGAVIEDGKAKIREYIAHREERENQILEVLKRGHATGSTSMEIVKVVYRDVPENLHDAANRGVLQVLTKMSRENRVAMDNQSEGKWRILGGDSSL